MPSVKQSSSRLDRIWTIGTNEWAEGSRILGSNVDWLTHAFNHWGGQIAKVLLRVINFEYQEAGDGWAGLPEPLTNRDVPDDRWIKLCIRPCADDPRWPCQLLVRHRQTVVLKTIYSPYSTQILTNLEPFAVGMPIWQQVAPTRQCLKLVTWSITSKWLIVWIT